MIKLKSILNENNVDPSIIAAPFFKKFYECLKCECTFKYMGLKNKEYIFTAQLADFGQLSPIIADSYYMARVTDKYAYFGIVYTLNGLEQFDATVCYMKNTNGKVDIKYFDDSDSDFADSKTNFLKIIKIMV